MGKLAGYDFKGGTCSLLEEKGETGDQKAIVTSTSMVPIRVTTEVDYERRRRTSLQYW
jgi:hypothetical protein